MWPVIALRGKNIVHVLRPREADISRAIVDLLALRGCFIYRQNAGGLVEHETGHFIRLAPEGSADYCGWVTRGPQRGKAVQVEIKAPGKKPTRLQLAWLKMAEDHGAISFWADSVAMAEEALDRHGI